MGTLNEIAHKTADSGRNAVRSTVKSGSNAIHSIGDSVRNRPWMLPLMMGPLGLGGMQLMQMFGGMPPASGSGMGSPGQAPSTGVMPPTMQNAGGMNPQQLLSAYLYPQQRQLPSGGQPPGGPMAQPGSGMRYPMPYAGFQGQGSSGGGGMNPQALMQLIQQMMQRQQSNPRMPGPPGGQWPSGGGQRAY